jgi:hypothetical protein
MAEVVERVGLGVMRAWRLVGLRGRCLRMEWFEGF